MTLDGDLLARARADLKAVDDAEAALVDARLRTRAADRELHRSGGSLREIATALSLSHERVHQLVTTFRATPVPQLGCAFCGAPQEHRRLDPAMAVLTTDAACHFCTKKAPLHVPALVVALSGTSICDGCLALAHEICAEDLPPEPADPA